MQWRLSTIILLLFLLSGSVLSAFANGKEDMLKEKIGQMLIIGFNGTELKPHDSIVEAILAQEISGVILFDYDMATKTYNRNIKNPKQLQHLTNTLQLYAQEAARKKNVPFLPLFISVDYEGGQVNRLKTAYGFPETLSAAELGQQSLVKVKRAAEQMAETLKKAGVNLNFAPVVDVNINPQNPVIGKLNRSFSADPDKVASLAAVFSKAYHDAGILCAYKHFPGHGSSSEDTHAGFVEVTHTFKPEELLPYKNLLPNKDVCPFVMVAHVVHRGLDPQGYPASLSHAIMTDLLRNKLHFNGVIITDDMQMKAITDHYGLHEALRLAINAGADLLIFGNQLVTQPISPKELIDSIYADVKAGKIKESRINEAYERIMQTKLQLLRG